MEKLTHITAREILDSRGNPTVEVTVRTDGGTMAWASVPSGASTGVHEAHELRDGDPQRYNGAGVLTAVRNVTETIAPALRGMDVTQQRAIDEAMIALDGTPNKQSLGANAILGVSLAVARAGAIARGIHLYEHIALLSGYTDDAHSLPIPMFNIINGGKHADSGLSIQEFKVVPRGVRTYAEQLRAGSEIFHALQTRLTALNLSTAVGNEGGFAPRLESNAAALALIEDASRDAGYTPGTETVIAIDAAAHSFVTAESGTYDLKPEGMALSAQSLIALYREWSQKYSLFSVEDGVDEDAWEDWTLLREQLGDTVMVVGDDLLVTNVQRLRRAIRERACTAVLIKPNQVGTLSETLDTMALARENDMQCIVSHRSGDTCDDFIADLAVGARAEYIKTGAPSRAERTAKYNRLLWISQQIEQGV